MTTFEAADPSCTCKRYMIGDWKQIHFNPACPFDHRATPPQPTSATLTPSPAPTAPPATRRPAKARTTRHSPGNGQQSII